MANQTPQINKVHTQGGRSFNPTRGAPSYMGTPGASSSARPRVAMNSRSGRSVRTARRTGRGGSNPSGGAFDSNHWLNTGQSRSRPGRGRMNRGIG